MIAKEVGEEDSYWHVQATVWLKSWQEYSEILGDDRLKLLIAL
jgi:predicted transcriptional regulator